MQEIKGNMWTFNSFGEWVCVTTNGIVKSNGCAVMGKGNAVEAAERYISLPRELGRRLKVCGNICQVFPAFRIITFPTKNNWVDGSSITLIKESCAQLMSLLDQYNIRKIYLPRPGCKNGHLAWCDVKVELEHLLDDRVYVIYN